MRLQKPSKFKMCRVGRKQAQFPHDSLEAELRPAHVMKVNLLKATDGKI